MLLLLWNCSVQEWLSDKCYGLTIIRKFGIGNGNWEASYVVYQAKIPPSLSQGLPRMARVGFLHNRKTIAHRKTQSWEYFSLLQQLCGSCYIFQHDTGVLSSPFLAAKPAYVFVGRHAAHRPGDSHINLLLQWDHWVQQKPKTLLASYVWRVSKSCISEMLKPVNEL